MEAAGKRAVAVVPVADVSDVDRNQPPGLLFGFGASVTSDAR
jgi:hypothetical protein